LLTSYDAVVVREDDGALAVSKLSAEAIGTHAGDAGIRLFELSPQRASLEEAFMELTRDSVEFHGHGTQPASNDSDLVAQSASSGK
jgi:ABC-2 type transport system ATP-binding protein